MRMLIVGFALVSALLNLVDVCLASEISTFDGYFDFSVSENLLRDGQEVSVKFKWNIRDFDMNGQKRLTVKPFLSSGAVEIFNPDLDRYIRIADFNSLLPYLRENMTVRFLGVESSSSPLSFSFTIYDNLTGKSYTTPAKKVWGIGYYKIYIQLLNENLLGENHIEGIAVDAGNESPTTQVDRLRDPPKLYLWYLAPAFFLYGLLKSPNGFG